MGVQAKTDQIDAKILAQTAELCAPSQPRSKEREALGDLSRSIGMLKKDRSGHLKRMKVPGFSKVAAQSLERLVKAIDKELLALEKAFVRAVGQSAWAGRYQASLTIPGVGPHLARCAICELPENLESWAPRQLASYAGVAPCDDSSGKRIGLSRVSKHGNAFLKAALYMPAMSLVRCDTWARQVYRRLRQKGLTHQQAIIPVMRKLLHQVVAVQKRGSAWQPDPPKRT